MKGSTFSLLSLFLLGQGSAFAQTQTIYLGAEENKFYQMVNQFRRKLNLPTLEIHVYLENAAKAHSAWMAKQDFLSHNGPTDDITPFERIEEQGYVNYTYAGENIACGHGDAIGVFRQWAASPLHLQNMLNPHYHQLGISRGGAGKERCPYYWTSDYGSFSQPGSDPATVTDTSLIQQAIAEVTGSALAKPLVLAPDPELPDSDPEKVTAEPTNPVIAARGTVSTLQCMIPYKLGKGALSNFANTDTLVEANRNQLGEVALKLSYFQNTRSANLSAVFLSGVSLVSNPDFPIVTLFAAPSRLNGGFSIQMNTKTNQAQYNSYNSIPAQSGTVLCTVKYF
ncbi:MAG: CAP domain-containing protein [Bdellovibrionales bacterium]|nr:CAP domain-containing protein [Oligoflexia bacterium]